MVNYLGDLLSTSYFCVKCISQSALPNTANYMYTEDVCISLDANDNIL